MADSRLFEKNLNENPSGQGLSNRIAFGKAGSVTLNMTLNGLITWLGNSLTGFLKKTENLNDLANKSTARTNLDVYAKSEVYTQSEVNSLITTTNNRFAGLSIAGAAEVDGNGTIGEAATVYNRGSGIQFTAVKIDAGRYLITHNLNTLAYMIYSTAWAAEGRSNMKTCDYERGLNSFYLETSDDSGRTSALFNFILFTY